MVNCLKGALQGVCAAGCWPERQQDIRVCGTAGRGWCLFVATLQVSTARGLSLLLASEDVFGKSPFDIKEDSLPSQSCHSVRF